MAKKKDRADGDVWPRKNKEGNVIGYHTSYWVETAEGPKRRYVSGKNKGETRAALSKAKAGREDGVFSDAATTKLGSTWTAGSRTPAAPSVSAPGSAASRLFAST